MGLYHDCLQGSGDTIIPHLKTWGLIVLIKKSWCFNVGWWSLKHISCGLHRFVKMWTFSNCLEWEKPLFTRMLYFTPLRNFFIITFIRHILTCKLSMLQKKRRLCLPQILLIIIQLNCSCHFWYCNPFWFFIVHRRIKVC